jgi:IS30 family transposase
MKEESSVELREKEKEKERFQEKPKEELLRQEEPNLFDAITIRLASPETIRVQLRIFRGLPDAARQSTTVDNGREHHRHMTLRFLGMTTYFCDPYSSWQRGTNENTNGLVRHYLPKGSSFRDLSQEDLDDIVEELNDRPRKCLGYNTPKEEFEKQLQCCT